jgi:hypothetical protein
MKQVKVGGLLCLTIMMSGWNAPQLHVSGMAAESISIQSQTPLLLQVDEQGNLTLDGEVIGPLETSELKERLRARLRERNTNSILATLLLPYPTVSSQASWTQREQATQSKSESQA